MKITNGQKILGVTKGAYESIFKQQGFYPYEEGKVKAQQEAKPTLSKVELFCQALKEKPISEWTKEETIDYVKIQAIDLKGEKNPQAIKDIIKSTF